MCNYTYCKNHRFPFHFQKLPIKVYSRVDFLRVACLFSPLQTEDSAILCSCVLDNRWRLTDWVAGCFLFKTGFQLIYHSLQSTKSKRIASICFVIFREELISKQLNGTLTTSLSPVQPSCWSSLSALTWLTMRTRRGDLNASSKNIQYKVRRSNSSVIRTLIKMQRNIFYNEKISSDIFLQNDK